MLQAHAHPVVTSLRSHAVASSPAGTILCHGWQIAVRMGRLKDLLGSSCQATLPNSRVHPSISTQQATPSSLVQWLLLAFSPLQAMGPSLYLFLWHSGSGRQASRQVATHPPHPPWGVRSHRATTSPPRSQHSEVLSRHRLRAEPCSRHSTKQVMLKGPGFTKGGAAGYLVCQ